MWALGVIGHKIKGLRKFYVEVSSNLSPLDFFSLSTFIVNNLTSSCGCNGANHTTSITGPEISKPRVVGEDLCHRESH